jgi:hypothetical protein
MHKKLLIKQPIAVCDWNLAGTSWGLSPDVCAGAVAGQGCWDLPRDGVWGFR